MHILFLDQFATLGGAQQCLLDLLPAVRQRASTAEVLLPEKGPLSEKLEGSGVDVQYFKGRTLSSKWKPLWELVPFCLALRHAMTVIDRIVTNSGPDILYVNGPRYLPAAARISALRNIPLVFHAHSRILQRAALRILCGSLKRCDSMVVACCRYVADPLRRVLPSQRIKIVYSGISRSPRSLPIGAGRIQRIALVGRLAPEKGQREFLEAMQLIREQAASLEIVVAGAPSKGGNAYLEAVMRAAQGLNVRFTGWANDVSSLIDSAHLVVVPSRGYDAAPRVVLEAFAAGVPVMATPAGGIPELIETDNMHGFLTRGFTPALIAERISRVLRMPQAELALVARNGQQRWREHFGATRYRNEIWEVLETRVESKSA